MDIKAYIESGILEAYVLGGLSEAERASVEADIALYPELLREVEAIEAAMENYAASTPIEPPAHLQEQIWSAIQVQQRADANSTHDGVPPVQQPVAEPAPKVVAFEPPAEQAPKMSWQRAAVWAAVAVSVLTNFMLLSQRNKINDEKAAMTARLDSMQAQQSNMLAKVEAYEKGRSMLADTGMKTVVMRSAQPGKDMTGMVFWSKGTGETYLTIHHMPMPEKGKQYQLWVIQEGKPVSMGVISNDLVANAGMMLKVPMQVQNGQAFAISLEKEGGNPTPTEVMIVGAI